MSTQSNLLLVTTDETGALVPLGGGRPIAILPNQSVVVCKTFDPLTGAQIPIIFSDPDGAGPQGEAGTPGTLWRHGPEPNCFWEYSDDAGETWITTENTWKGVATAVVTPIVDGSISMNALLDALFGVGLISVDKTAVLAELAKIHDVDIDSVPFGTSNTKSAIEAAILVIANGLVGAGYTVTIMAGSTYATGTGIWTGKFTVTNNATPLNTISDTTIRTITVTIESE